MVVLREIKKSNRIIEADFYPEGKDSVGHISVDFMARKTVSLNNAEGYEHSSSASHAKAELLRLAKLDSLPDVKRVYWY